MAKAEHRLANIHDIHCACIDSDGQRVEFKRQIWLEAAAVQVLQIWTEALQASLVKSSVQRASRRGVISISDYAMHSSCQGSAPNYSKPHHQANSANPGTLRGLKLFGLCVKGTMLERSVSPRACLSSWQATRFKIEQCRRCRSTAGGAWAACAASKILASRESLLQPGAWPCRRKITFTKQCSQCTYFHQSAQSAAQSTNARAKECFPGCGSPRSQ